MKKHTLGCRHECRAARGEESLVTTFLAHPSGCTVGPAPATVWWRGRKRWQRREGVGVLSDDVGGARGEENHTLNFSLILIIALMLNK
jgi:hypothetical protein